MMAHTHNSNIFSGIIIGTVISSIMFMGFYYLVFGKNTEIKSNEVAMQMSENAKIAMFYETEVATNVSAHGLRKKIQQNNTDFILVDIRSKEEYDKGHIKGAISIPAYINKDNTGEVSKTRILSAFSALDSDKELIMYCYSHYCMSSRKIGHFLSQNGVYVKHLTVGWNEWRYNWKLWNYPHEKDNTQAIIEVNPFIESQGKAPGCGMEGEFSC